MRSNFYDFSKKQQQKKTMVLYFCVEVVPYMGVHIFIHLRHFTNYILLMQAQHYHSINLQNIVVAKVTSF